ncbi:YbaB/EbfC family nucleoid-associated protein [Micromonospora sp. NPDC049799]|uniref:YbaB/EbfC family nucleoid-associated protein n=1 Tax=Micromonospora sp. NPDC049799 TaxID=3154741 RepID=UPI0033EBA861
MALAENVDRDTNRALRARFDDVYGQYQRLRSGLDELQTRLTELRVTERSSDGRVTAVVGARGEVIQVEVSPAAYQERDAKGLSRAITETVQRAGATAAEETRQLVATYLPGGSGPVEFLRTGDFGSLLGRADAALRREE